MSNGDYTDEELEALRRRRMAELQRSAYDEQRRSQAQQQVDRQKQSIIRQILTPEARQRLANIRMVKPEFAEELEMQLIQLAQSGRLQTQITDEQLKRTLVQLQSQKKRDQDQESVDGTQQTLRKEEAPIARSESGPTCPFMGCSQNRG